MSETLGDSVAITRARLRLLTPTGCHEGVTRKTGAEPCGKAAIALRYWSESDDYYPVCATHARGFCLPMVDPDHVAALLDALTLAESRALAAEVAAEGYRQQIEREKTTDAGRAIAKAAVDAALAEL